MKNSTIFSFNDYKDFVRHWMETQARGGRGLYAKLAKELGVHSTLISQILNNHKNFTMDQAFRAALFMGLEESEREFFMDLVSCERAGDYQLKNYYQKKLKKMSLQARQASKQLPRSKSLSAHDQALYYSDPLYILTKLLTSVEEFQSMEAIADHLKISPSKLRGIIDFLCRFGLVENKKGHLIMGTAMTHLDASSPWVATHHRNWRLKSLEHLPSLTSNELVFTGPLSLSRDDFEKVRSLLLEVIKKVGSQVEASRPELVGCLNIDFFKLT